jgi:hypothetical protein
LRSQQLEWRRHTSNRNPVRMELTW